MEIRQLRYFVTVAELGSFSRASEALGIAQPALSRQIQQLEHETKTQLLLRHTRGVVTTRAGALLLARAHLILEQIEQTKAEVSFESGEEELKLAIGMPIAVMSLLSSELPARVSSRYPKVRLRLVEGYSAYLHEWLLSGSIDMALLYSVPDAAVRHDPLVVEDLCLVASSTFDLGGKTSVSSTELGNTPLILPQRPHPTWDLLDRAGIRVTEHIPADAMGQIIELTKSGAGCTVLSYASVRKEVAHGSLVAIPIRKPSVNRVVSLCHASFRTMPRSFTTMFDYVAGEIRDIARNGKWPGGVSCG